MQTFTSLVLLSAFTSLVSAQSASTSASGAIQTVQVGAQGLSFTPDTITANAGDVVEFVFGEGHSVAESTFDAPCQPISGAGIYSGFPGDGTIFSVTVNDTKPVWIYCSATGHCQGGMAMVINPPSSGNTLDAYKSAAANAQTGSPANIAGGIFGPPSQAQASSSGAPSSAATSSAGSAPSSTGFGFSTTSSSSPSTASSSASASASAHSNGAADNFGSNTFMVLGAVAAGAAFVL